MFRYLRGDFSGQPRVGLFPGAFNPVTVAHLAVAQTTREQYGLGQVVFVLPGKFPHKVYEGASLDERVALLGEAIEDHLTLAVASTSGGLFVEIVREFAALAGSGAEAYVLCGRDAAERFAAWDDPEHDPVEQQLREFQLLVASREGDYQPPPDCRSLIHRVRMSPGYEEVSSSAVRQAIRQQREWKHLVPPKVAAYIEERRLY